MADPLGLIQAGGSAAAIGPMRPAVPKIPGEDSSTSFKDVLMKQLDQVNRLQQDADMAIEDLATGKRDDLDAVVMAKKKADVAFQMLVEVHRKMLDAYEEIKQMRV